MTIELTEVASGYSTGVINSNFEAIEAYINDNLLNRDGTETGEPNQMEVSLDMNSNFIFNLPEPVLEHQAARLQDVQNALADNAANLITFTPYGNISSENVQGAIQELVDGTGQSITTSTGTQTLAGALDDRAVVVGSLASLKSLDGSQISDGQVFLVEGVGKFYFDANDTATVPDEVIVVANNTTGIFKSLPENDFDITYYVSTAGSDANGGLDPSDALLTPQAAADKIALWAPVTRGQLTIKLAPGTYTSGIVLDGVLSWKEIVIEGNLNAGVPDVIIDGPSAGVNCNAGVRARVKWIKTQNCTSNGIVFQNGSIGNIDTCDCAGCPTFGFNASEFSDMNLIGACNIDVPTGGRGLRWYRKSHGSLGDGTNTITLDAGGLVADGIQVRNNSSVVADNGIVVNGFQNIGIDVFNHSYLELRDHTVSNNNIARRARADGIIALAGSSSGTGNTKVDDYGAFSYEFFQDTLSTIHGEDGRTSTSPDSNYHLLFRNNGNSGIQALLNGSSFNIDANKSERLSLVNSDNTLRFWTGGVDRYRMRANDFIPVNDNARNLGNASFRWSEVFAANGTINTSDEREKQQVRDLSEAERRVAKRLKTKIRAFKWSDSVSEKGDAARTHFGVMAQEVGRSFEEEGLDPNEYGMFCYDEWPAEADDDGAEILPAGNRYGVRYEELLAFIISAM